jgi:hypothetical protein
VYVAGDTSWVHKRSGTGHGSGEAFAESQRDPVGVAGDLVPGVLVHQKTEVGEFASPLPITFALGVSGVTAPAVDLDDDAMILEQEIDAGNVSIAFAVNHLRPRSGEAGFSDELEESPFKHRVPA